MGHQLQYYRFVLCKQLFIPKNDHKFKIKSSCQRMSNFLFYPTMIILLLKKSRKSIIQLHTLRIIRICRISERNIFRIEGLSREHLPDTP